MGKGAEGARDVASAFDEICSKVADFRKQCLAHNSNTMHSLDYAIADLERQIRDLSKSFRRVTNSFAQMWQKPDVTKQELSKRKREIREANHLGKDIERHADTLYARMKSFSTIWNLIYDDGLPIKFQLENVASSHIPKMFHQRMVEVPGQYAGLQEALQNYANALSDDQSENRWFFESWIR